MRWRAAVSTGKRRSTPVKEPMFASPCGPGNLPINAQSIAVLVERFLGKHFRVARQLGFNALEEVVDFDLAGSHRLAGDFKMDRPTVREPDAAVRPILET